MDKTTKREQVIKAARLSIYSNTLLVCIKMLVGILMGSVSILSEAIHSGIDLVAAIIANVSVRKASIPPDKDHRFGHGKFENISGTVEALLIFTAAFLIIYESVKKLMNPSPIELVGAGIAVMGISMTVNYFISRRLMAIAEKEDSIALEVDAYHLTTDVYTSAGVFVGMLFIQAARFAGYPGFERIDPVIAIFIALAIMKAAFDMTKRSVEGLVDARLSDKEENIIRSVISKHYSQFAEFHALRTRKAGSERFVDLHLVVPAHQQVASAHEFCDHIENEIKEYIPNLNILIHVEPCEENCEMCKKLKNCDT